MVEGMTRNQEVVLAQQTHDAVAAVVHRIREKLVAVVRMAFQSQKVVLVPYQTDALSAYQTHDVVLVPYQTHDVVLVPYQSHGVVPYQSLMPCTPQGHSKNVEAYHSSGFREEAMHAVCDADATAEHHFVLNALLPASLEPRLGEGCRLQRSVVEHPS